MPSRNEIYSNITGASDAVRRQYLADLSAYTERDTILYSTGFISYKPNVPGTFYSVSLQDMQGFMAAVHGLKKDNLDFVIHSPGGSLEAAEQIVKYLRSKFTNIRVIIPQNAMSAATMLACAADEIIMGKHSALGPIDPQITFTTPTGPFTAPAQSILDEFELAKKEITGSQAAAALWIKRIDKYPQGFLKICENTIKLAQDRVTDWLETWMFAGDTDAHNKAAKIAQWLGTADNHLTHGRPIDINEAVSQGLIVNSLEDDQTLQEKVLSVFHSTMATHDTTNCLKLIENNLGKGFYVNAK